MEARIKVSDFYKPIQTLLAIPIPKLSKAFFRDDSLYVTTANDPLNLHRYSLKQRAKQLTIPLPYQDLQDVQEIQDIICFYFKDRQNLWAYSHSKLMQISSHFAPITSLARHQNRMVTGSADMTVRRWNLSSGHDLLIQDNDMHVLAGHTSRVNCFLSLPPLLLSGSDDRSVIVWHGTSIASQKKFDSAIRQISLCQESQQIAILQHNSSISIVNLTALQKRHQIVVNRAIQAVTIPVILQLNQIDDSFLQIVGEQQLEVAQINIGTVMAKPQLEPSTTILASKCIRRLTLLAVAGRGVVIMTF